MRAQQYFDLLSFLTCRELKLDFICISMSSDSPYQSYTLHTYRHEYRHIVSLKFELYLVVVVVLVNNTQDFSTYIHYRQVEEH